MACSLVDLLDVDVSASRRGKNRNVRQKTEEEEEDEEIVNNKKKKIPRRECDIN